MPRDGTSGTYSAPVSSWNPAVNGTLMVAADWTALLNDLVAALTQSVSKNGQTTMTGSLPMGGQQLLNLAAASVAGNALVYGQASALLTSLSVSGGRLNTAQGADVPSAATINLDSATGNIVDVTGTTSITAVTLSQGRTAIVRFTGSLTLTNGASLILPGGVDIQTTPGDYAFFVGYSGGVVRCLYFPIGAAQAVPQNSLAASAAGSALTVTVKAGTPLHFRSATAATGTDQTYMLPADLSLTVSNGSTLGVPAAANTPFKLWLVVFNDAGTYRLGIINCLSGTSIYPLAQFPIASSTAEGGAGAADSAQVFYTGVAVTSKPYAVVGYVTYETGLASVGVWGAAPTRVQSMQPWVPLPGVVIRQIETESGTVLGGLTTVFAQGAGIPSNTQGDSLNTVLPDTAITPTSAANLLRQSATVVWSASSGASSTLALYQDATVNALAATIAQSAAGSAFITQPLTHTMRAGTTSSTTFKLRLGNTGGNTTTVNGAAGAVIHGGVMASRFCVEEISA